MKKLPAFVARGLMLGVVAAVGVLERAANAEDVGAWPVYGASFEIRESLNAGLGLPHPAWNMQWTFPWRKFTNESRIGFEVEHRVMRGAPFLSSHRFVHSFSPVAHPNLLAQWAAGLSLNVVRPAAVDLSVRIGAKIGRTNPQGRRCVLGVALHGAYGIAALYQWRRIPTFSLGLFLGWTPHQHGVAHR